MTVGPSSQHSFGASRLPSRVRSDESWTGAAHSELAPAPASATVSAPLLTTDQAAGYLQVSVRTVKNLMCDGQIAYIKIGRATRIHRQDLDEYIARNRRKQRSRLRAS